MSWYDGQNHDLANEFFGLLKKHGFDVELSPYSPHSGFYDKRWGKWYDEGLPKAINQADIFIAVITLSCDSSTWMMQEYQEAYLNSVKNGKLKLYYIRFDPIEQQVKYPEEYLHNSIRLSSIPKEAISELLTYNS
jgi:hypothetical protein